jgi:hypothetical protein
MRDEMRDMREIEGGSKEVKLSHSPERNAGAGEEIFIFPITDEGVLRSYLTRPGAEEFLVAFAFSGALQDALAAEGILAIQNDTRDSEGEGPHFKGDFRVIVNIKEWRGIFFGGPPCFQHLRADEDCLEHKIADGRAFFAGLVVFYCICAGWALMRVVEQPDTICYDILDPAVDGSGVALFEVSSTQFGDSWHKFFRFALRNATLPPAEHPRRRNYGRATEPTVVEPLNLPTQRPMSEIEPGVHGRGCPRRARLWHDAAPSQRCFLLSSITWALLRDLPSSGI